MNILTKGWIYCLLIMLSYEDGFFKLVLVIAGVILFIIDILIEEKK